MISKITFLTGCVFFQYFCWVLNSLKIEQGIMTYINGESTKKYNQNKNKVNFTQKKHKN